MDTAQIRQSMYNSPYAYLAILCLSMLSVLFFIIWTIIQMRQYEDDWQRYAETPAQKKQLIFSLYKQTGYGGFIHNFKNYVLRGDTRYKDAAEVDYLTVQNLLSDYRRFTLAPAEIDALNDINAVIRSYEAMVPIVTEMKAAGKKIIDIDQADKIDDTPMIQALSTLSVFTQKTTVSGNQSIQKQYEKTKVVIVYVIVFFLVSFGAGLFTFFKIKRLQSDLDKSFKDLAVREEMFRQSLNINAHGTILVTKDGVIEYFNKSAAKMFDLSIEDALGRNISTLMPDSIAADHHDYIQKSQISGQIQILPNRRMQGKKSNGALFPIEIFVAPMTLNGEKKYIANIRDLTAQINHENNLIRAKLAAEASLQSKVRFFSNINHELRTPLNAIIGFSDVLASGALGDRHSEKHDEYIKDIRSAGFHLLALINDILDIARIEENRFKLNIDEANITKIVEESLVLNRENANKKSITLTCEGFDGLDTPHLECDSLRVKQILVNILANAIRFTPIGGQVTVGIELREPWIEIKISDTGPGVPQAEIANILKPFEQADHSFTKGTDYSGSGLGLPISKFLVEAHGGQFKFTSELDVGSTVYITLPLSPTVAD